MVDVGDLIGFDCTSTLCPVWVNGAYVDPATGLQNHDHGTFLTLQVVEDNQNIQAITGPIWLPPTPTRPRWPYVGYPELADTFPRRMAHLLHQRLQVQPNRGHVLTVNLQLASPIGTDGRSGPVGYIYFNQERLQSFHTLQFLKFPLSFADCGCVGLAMFRCFMQHCLPRDSFRMRNGI